MDEIVQELENHKESLRIKKLVFCACKGRWENNPKVLSVVPLKPLIQELRGANSSIEVASKLIYQIVESLNRQDVYAVIANIIISQLNKLYQDSEESTQIVLLQAKQTQPILFISDVLLEEISTNLMQHQEAIRIKKLIFAVNQQRWQNDQAMLEQYQLQDLIFDLRQQHLTRDTLKTAFYTVTESLNRQKLYTSIADIILQELDALYDEPEDVTGVLPAPIIINQQESPQVAKSPSQVLTDKKSKDITIDPFALRLEVIKYTNPLRAKILLYSLLYQKFDPNERDWSILRTCDLCSLLLQLSQTYTNYKDLESQLYLTAKNLFQPDENLQAAGAIIQALKTLLAKK